MRVSDPPWIIRCKLPKLTVRADVTSIAVERIAAAFPAVALQPEVRGLDEVDNIEDRLRMFSRSIQSIMRREFPNFNLWAELRIGGNAANSDVEMS